MMKKQLPPSDFCLYIENENLFAKERRMPVDSYAKELGRKTIHVLVLILLVVYFFVAARLGRETGLLVLVAFLVLGIVLEYLRLEYRLRPPLLSYLWDNLRREEEQNVLGADIFFMLGVIVALAVYDIRVATAVIFMTTFGDLAAALIGKKYGKVRPAIFKGKSIEGALAALLVNFIIGVLFLRTTVDSSVWWARAFDESGGPGSFGGFGEPLWPLIVVTSFVSTTVELASSKISDNLTIPLISGFAGQVTLLLTRCF